MRLLATPGTRVTVVTTRLRVAIPDDLAVVYLAAPAIDLIRMQDGLVHHMPGEVL
jgi:hypothetical protein